MGELLQTVPTVIWVVLILTTLITLAGFGHLLWMWRKSSSRQNIDVDQQRQINQSSSNDEA